MNLETKPAAKIDILMGIYNGAEYMEATLESLRKQTFRDWCLWVRDDGSTDQTVAILEKWKEQLGDRMRILPNPEKKNLGVYGNFSCVLEACTAPYVSSAAHDDIYHPDKLALTMAAMEREEARVGPERPIVVYTDQRVIDGESELISPSLWQHAGWSPPKSRPFAKLLIQNGIYGGTTLINRPLIKLLGDPPRCDDTWFAWLGAIYGELVPLPIQTVDFRRHGNNHSDLISLGSTIGDVARAPWQASRLLHFRLEELRPDVERFFTQYRNSLPEEQRATVEALLGLSKMNFFQRRWALLRYGLLYTSWLRAAGMLVLI